MLRERSWSVAGLANSRDARTSARAVSGTQTRLRGRGRLLRERSWSVAGLSDSRPGVLVPSGDRPGPTEPAGETGG